MPAIRRQADAERGQGIRAAVAHAIKGRGPHAQEQIAYPLRSLESAANDVVQRASRFRDKAALKPRQQTRAAILRDPEKAVEGNTAEF